MAGVRGEGRGGEGEGEGGEGTRGRGRGGEGEIVMRRNGREKDDRRSSGSTMTENCTNQSQMHMCCTKAQLV